MNDFETALNNWLAAVKAEVLDPQINNEWQAKWNEPYTTLHLDGGTKFLRIVHRVSGSQNGSAWAFVATTDGSSKALGSYKRGDIFKPASYKAPAKTARGNIFDTSNGATCNVKRWTGPDYLK